MALSENTTPNNKESAAPTIMSGNWAVENNAKS